MVTLFLTSFNSKLVRLKVQFDNLFVLSLDVFQFQIGSIKSCLDGRKVVLSAVLEFQFQIGSIKSVYVRRCAIVTCVFQFQIGSIKSFPRLRFGRGSLPSFNSKLVRLKVRGFRRAGWVTSAFQFQIGSIKRCLWWICCQASGDVSIPNWFD